MNDDGRMKGEKKLMRVEEDRRIEKCRIFKKLMNLIDGCGENKEIGFGEDNENGLEWLVEEKKIIRNVNLRRKIESKRKVKEDKESIFNFKGFEKNCIEERMKMLRENEKYGGEKYRRSWEIWKVKIKEWIY